LTELGCNLALQFEMCGEGIQKNRYHLRGQKLFLYDIWDIDKQQYMLPAERRELARKLFLAHVPVVEEKYQIFTQHSTIDQLLSYANQESIMDPKELPHLLREGIVLKSNELVGGHSIHFKIINNEYLLRNGE